MEYVARIGYDMAQAVSQQPLEARIRDRVSSCGICGRQRAMRQVYLRVIRFSPVSVIPP